VGCNCCGKKLTLERISTLTPSDQQDVVQALRVLASHLLVLERQGIKVYENGVRVNP
jgi:hypothetical protein